MPLVANIILGAAITLLTSLSLGRLLIRALSLCFSAAEYWLFSFLLGSASFSLLMFALSAIHQVHRGVIYGLCLVTFVLASYFDRNHKFTDLATPIPIFWTRVFLAGFAGYGLLYICFAMAPEHSPDGSSYHLGLVSQMSRAFGFVASPEDFYKNMPAGLELLFLSAFVFGKHSAAALVHLLFLLSLPLLMVSFGCRFRYVAASVVGALLVFVAPVVGIDGTSAYVDVALAATLFGTFYLLQLWDHQQQTSLLIAAAVLCGFAFAIKYTGAIGLLYAFLFVTFRSWSRGQRLAPSAALLVAISSLWILPWLLKNWILTGNPFTPFFSQVFPSPNIHPSFLGDWLDSLRHYNLPNYWQLPLEV